MGFFQSEAPEYIERELKARANPVVASKLKPWIVVRSNVSPGKILGSLSYTTFGQSYDSDLRPNPLITDWSIDFSSRGTLRKGTLKIKCFSVKQLEEIQKYFMEPGMSVFVQWGWTQTASTGMPISPLSFDPGFQKVFYRSTEVLQAYRNDKLGCYDNMLGIISKAESSVNGNEFEVQCKIVSLGELLSGMPSKGVSTSEDNENSTEGNPKAPTFSDSQIQENRKKGNWKAASFMCFYNEMPDSLKDARIYNLWNSNEIKGGEFVNYDKSITDYVKDETQDASWYEFTGDNDFDFLGKNVIPQDDESPVSPNRYVKFDFLIKMYNLICTVKDGSNPSNPNFPIDIGTKLNPRATCGAFREIYSPNSSIFIPNDAAHNWYSKLDAYTELPSNSGTDDRYSGTYGPAKATEAKAGTNYPASIDNSVPTTDPVYPGYKISFPDARVYNSGDGNFLNPYTWGWIGDIYVEHGVGMSFLESFEEGAQAALTNILQTMCDAVGGLWYFQPGEAEKGGQRIIIKDYAQKAADTPKPLELFLYGEKSVFLDASFNFDIPKALASRVIMVRSTAGTANETEPREPITSLFSKDAKDDVLTEEFLQSQTFTPPPVNPATPAKTSDEILKEGWIKIRQHSQILIKPDFKGEGYYVDKWLMPGVGNDLQIFMGFVKKGAKEGTTSGSGSPLPIKVNFTVLGISGFKFGNLLSIKGLPEKYSDPKTGYFQIIEVKHKVDNKLWTTEVEAHFRPLPASK